MSILNTITEIGISDQLDSETQKRIRVINQVSVLTWLMAVAGTGVGLFLRFPKEAMVIIAGTVLFMFIPISLNSAGKHVISRLVFLMASWALITCLGIAFGLESHYQYYVIGGVGMPLLFFNNEIGNWKWAISALAIPIYAFITWYGNHYQPLFLLESEILNPLSIFNDLLVIMTVGATIAIFTSQQRKQLVDYERVQALLQKQSADLEQKSAELAEESEVFNFILESSMAGYWDWYVKEDYEYMSPTFKAMFGYEDHEVPNHPSWWQKQIHPDDLPGVLELFNKHVESRGKVPFHNEVRYRHKNGHQLWVYCRGKVIEWDSDGQPIRMVGSHVDITDLKRTQKELENRNKEMNEFSYIASHDLQEPINTINSFSSMLLRKYGKELDETAKDYLGYIIASGIRGKQLIGDLLDYSKLGIDKTLIESRLRDIAQEAIDDLNSKIEQTQATIDLNIDSKFSCRLHQLEIRLLFQNLISNAIKFCPEDRNPLITIDATATSNLMLISVKDNGIGIDSKHFEKIFELFGRLHLKDEFSGTGIGLAHCKKIAELHGGRIWLESTPGEGSTFHFTMSRQL